MLALLSYIIEEIVLEDYPLAKAIVLETYKILTYEVVSHDGDTYIDGGGVYRDDPGQ